MPLPTPTLNTPRLRLRPFAQTDTDAIFALQSSARVLRYWDAPPWKEPAQAERFIAACRQLDQEGDRRTAGHRARRRQCVHWLVRFGQMESGLSQREAGLLP